MDITITAQVTPTFTQIGPLCQFSTAPALPGTSTNGVTGTWSPATINTTTAGTATYTFTPNNPSQCATTDTKSTRINSSHTRISYAVVCLYKISTAPAL